MGNIQMQSIKP